MASKNKDFKHEVIEHLGNLKEYSSGNTKEVMRMIWGDNPITLDIRLVNNKTGFIGKGVSISDDEADKLTDILIENGYGSIEIMKERIVKQMRRTDMSVENITDCGDEFIDACYEEEDGTKVIDINEYE